MLQPGTNAYVASVARGVAARPRSQEFEKLSSEMCWDAVAHCLQLAGFERAGLQLPWLSGLVNARDPQVTSAAGMRAVPEGHVIGFFTKRPGAAPFMHHEMIAVGDGLAAGNKNSRIGLGGPVGWEILDLAKLDWQPDGHVVGDDGIELFVHHRQPHESLHAVLAI